jgi:GDPmannose 4,6-dehydratase
MRNQRILVTGGAGQLGRHVVQKLRARGATIIVGARRGGAWEILTRTAEGDEQVPFELDDASSIHNAVGVAKPTAVIHLAAPSYVAHTWSYPTATFSEIAMGTLHLLEAVRSHAPEAKLIAAASSDMFVRAIESPQTTTTPYSPANPYGIAKAAAAELLRSYRTRFDLSFCNAVLYVLESQYRSTRFVMAKVADAAAAIALGQCTHLELGDLEARRDWLYAGDAADALLAALDAGARQDVLIGSGDPHSVRDLVEAAFRRAGISDWQQYVRVDPALVRPKEGVLMTPSLDETERAIGWRPSTSFEQLVALMVDAALARRRTGGRLPDAAT